MRKGSFRRAAAGILRLLQFLAIVAAFLWISYVRTERFDLSEVFTVLLLLGAVWWVLRSRAIDEMSAKRLVLIVILALVIFFYVYPGIWRYRTGTYDRLTGYNPISTGIKLW